MDLRNTTRRVACKGSLLGLAAFAIPAFAAAPEQNPVVSAQFINPDAPYPESHASTIAEVAPGKFVAAWFGGTKERSPDVTIWVARYQDGRWLPATSVADGVQDDGTRHPTWNPVLFQEPDGPLHLYYKVGPQVSSWKGVEIVSQNQGKNWSAPRALPAGILGPVKNKPVVVPDGSWLSGSSTEGEAGWLVHFERSRDQGETWTKIGPVLKGSLAIDGIQPSILIHRDGSLQSLGRTNSGHLFTTRSRDGGDSWSPLTLSELPNPNSGTDAVTLADGRHLMIYNHSTTGTVRADKGYRYPLDVAISDDGEHWKHVLVLEDEPSKAGYAYPSVIQASDGLVHITYTFKRDSIKHVVLDPQKLR